MRQARPVAVDTSEIVSLRTRAPWRGVDFFVLGAVAALGALVVVYATRFGPGINADSVRYINAAKYALSGQGLFTDVDGRLEPLTHFPPLMSLILATSGVLGADMLTFGRWFGVALMALNTFSVGAIVFLWTRSRAAAVLAALFFVIAPTVIDVHSTVQTEPLFLLLMLWSFHFLARYLQLGERRLLLAAATLTAFAFQTRYAAAAMVIYMTLAIAAGSNQRLSKRLVDSSLFAVIAAGPIVLWFVRIALLGGSSREFAFHPVSIQELSRGLDSVIGWLNPGFYNVKRRYLIPVLAAIGVFLATRLRRKDFPKISEKYSLAAVMLAFIPSYIVFLLATISFFDARTPLDPRLLLPAFTLALVIGALVVAHVLEAAPEWPARTALLVLVVWFGTSFATASERSIHKAHARGIGFNGLKWRESPVLSYLKALPPQVSIFSNWHRAVNYAANRQALTIPQKRDPWSDKENPNYANDLRALCISLRSGSVIAYFPLNRHLPYLPTEAELNAVTPLTPVVTDTLATVYKAAPSARSCST